MKSPTAIRFWAPFLLAGAVSLAPLAEPALGQTNQPATQPLLEKAHALEVRGRMDMASQTWQQVLLVDPNNTEALGGLARAARLRGDQADAQKYLNRLRAVNPNDPGIARAENVGTQQDHNAQLQQAGKLAAQGQYAQSMNVYRQVYGNTPPPGDGALAYYDTEASTEEGRPAAIEGLRALASKYPSDSRYQVTLGRILTYNPKTRAEGQRLLEAHPNDPAAVKAYRDSLLYDSKNPATGPQIRAYLARHPDAQLETALHELPRQAPQARPAVPLTPEQRLAAQARSARTAEDQAAYRELNAHHLPEAEARFKASLAKNANDPDAEAGMGYVDMQRANFGGALSFLTKAKQDGSKDRGLDSAIQTSRFYNIMSEGQIALNENDLAGAEKNYRAALGMRPNDPQALEALGGTLLKDGQPQAAIPYFQQFVHVQPNAPHAWRGLFLSQYGAGQSPAALRTEQLMPPGIRAQLSRDPLYLRGLSSAYSSVGRDADAQRVLRSALDLPFPAGAGGLEADTQLQYASLLQAAGRLEQAAGLYRQLLSKDQNNTSAWEGLVRVEHQMDQDAQAIETLESMPPASYAQSMRDVGFEQTVASIYQSQRRYDVAQSLLEKAIAQQTTAGQRPSPAAQIQLAGIYLQRDNPQQAYPLYAQVLSANSGNTDAWKGLLSSLHDTGRDNEALAQVRQIPAPTRVVLENDPDYLQTVAAVYNALGQGREAEVFLRRVQQHYAAQHALAPGGVDVQDAWLLYNAHDDRGLYRQLMMLGDRNDLSVTERRTVQLIWANFAVRRADQEAAAGNRKLAVETLNATARAFPDNPDVLKTLAGGYASAGMAKQAVAIWRSRDLRQASVVDYRAAVGAALADNDSKDAETWLRFGLEQYPHDSQLLSLGARFEVARGDNTRAVDYYHASLDAMPPVSPGAELAEELSQPAPAPPGQVSSGAATRSLAGLLQPSAAETGAAPAQPPPPQPLYLPGYGNSSGAAPVQRMNSAGGTDYGVVGSRGGLAPVTGNSQPALPSDMNPPGPPTNNPRARLRDYAPPAPPPQSSLMPGPLGPEHPAFAPAHYRHGGSQAMLIAAVYHPRAAVRMVSDGPGGLPWQQGQYGAAGTAQNSAATAQNGTSSGQNGQAAAPSSVRITAQPTGPAAQRQNATSPSGTARPGTTQQASPAQPGNSDSYGPYVPYVPPPVTPVQLGAGPAATARPGNAPEVTDVLPRARYVPNARTGSSGSAGSGRSAGSSHSDIAAAEAARARRRQSEVTRTGQSAPPEEDIRTTPMQPTVYQPYRPYVPPAPAMSQAQGQNGGAQVSQPGSTTLPAQQQTGVSSSVPQQSGESYGQQYPQPNTRYTNAQPVSRGRVRSRRAAAPVRSAAEPVPVASPAPTYQGLSYPGVGGTGQTLGYQPYPTIGPAYPLGTPPSDEDLMQQRLPPLRGRYYTGDLPAAQVPLTERQQTERELETLQASYSGWIGGTASARYRSGTVGLDRLTDLETSVELSATVGNGVRFTVVPKAVFLNSGALDTANSTNSSPVLGTLPGNAATAPAQQFANGVGGEFQVATRNFAGAVGYTPYEFLVRNVTGRLLFRAGQHFTFYGDRSPVTETQLSYAGLRDPGSATNVFSGNIWGGVIATGGGLRYEQGNERAGFYLTADGADLSGTHVLENNKFEGSAGAYFLAHTFPGYGRLNVGASVFGMHYAYNERGLTYGLGGYFSPEAYLLVSVPVTFAGRYHDNFHYVVNGSVGVQTFQEDSEAYFPLDRALQTGIAVGSPTQTAANSNTGGNYSINSEGAYRISEHWYAGGFLSANNTNNYNTVTGGFFVRYLFRPQFATEDYPTGLFPVEGFRPLRVP